MADTDTLINTLAENMAPSRPAAHPLALFVQWLAGSALYVAVAVFFLHPRPDLPEMLLQPMFSSEVALLLAMMLASALAAIALSFPDLHQMRWAVLLPILPFAAFVLLMGIGWLHDNPALPRPNGIDCLRCITLLAVLPAGWLFWRLRRQASVHYYATGGLTLLAASSLGAFALRLAEDTDSIIHVIEWHYLPMIGFGMAGLWLGRTFLKW